MSAIDQLIATQYQRTAGPSPSERLAGAQSLQGQKLNNQLRQQNMAINEESLATTKRTEGLKFAANVASQLRRAEDPAKRAELYDTARYLAQKNGYSLEGMPEQYNDQAQQMLDIAHMQIFNPDQYQAALVKAGFSGDQTKSSKTYPNGLTVQSTGSGIRVLAPTGKELTGQEAADAIREANELEVEQQRSIYSARSGGTVQGKRESGAVELAGDTKAAEEAGKLRGQREGDKAGLEANIAGAKAGASETAKLEAQLAIKPKIQEAIKTAELEAKSRGEVLSEYGRAKAAMPGLTEVVNKLITLSDVATYTMGGKAFDTIVKELGFGATKGATARAKMESMVDNQILPLLRDTFGAQFTAKEGEQLRKTMLDIDAAPEQKKEILNSFIEQKMRDLEMKRGRAESVGGPAEGQETTKTVNWGDLP